MQIGFFTLVLNSHLPYCRLAGRWPHGEEWIHEAIAETYIPLLNALTDLHEAGLPSKLTIGLTPVLVEQLADPLVLDHFDRYLEERIGAAQGDIERFSAEGNAHLCYLASFYKEWYSQIGQAFQGRYKRDLVGAFRRLQNLGAIEIVTSAATHSYLPLLGTDSSIYAQIKTGVAAYQHHFGLKPRAIWLPECGYRPAYFTEDGRVRPGIESFLAEEGLGLFFAETHTIEGGEPVGVAAGEAIGPYGAIKRRYVLPKEDYSPPQERTTLRPYYVLGSAERDGTHPGVAVIGRHNRVSMQVWSADWGYPGDYDYREFHKKDGLSGLRYWRITSAKSDLAYKEYYHPDWAEWKVGEHARHFAWLVREILSSYHRETGQRGIVAAIYDTELFGHWWFEGIDWIKKVIQELATSQGVGLTTATGYVEARPPTEVLALPEGSWGVGGGHFTWDNGDTHWMWGEIHEAERRMEGLAARYEEADQGAYKVLNQAARELLLLQSSDWPFLVTTGQAREYAIHRFQSHLERFSRLADSLEIGHPDQGLAEEYWEQDKVFPHIDYHWFLPR